jgi:hypothetical protein
MWSTVQVELINTFNVMNDMRPKIKTRDLFARNKMFEIVSEKETIVSFPDLTFLWFTGLYGNKKGIKIKINIKIL